MSKEKTVPVRLDRNLVPPLRRVIAGTKDEFGLRKYRSVSNVVSEAVKEFLKRQKGVEVTAS